MCPYVQTCLKALTGFRIGNSYLSRWCGALENGSLIMGT